MAKSAVPAALALAGLAKGGKPHVGPIISAVPGRHDEHPIDVKSESFVFPADVVSALGEGNTLAGMEVLKHRFGAQMPVKRADGGNVPIIAAGGEFVLPPEGVAAAGNGNIAKGHAALRKFVTDVRKKHIKTLKKLPGPHK